MTKYSYLKIRKKWTNKNEVSNLQNHLTNKFKKIGDIIIISLFLLYVSNDKQYYRQ
jgi:hypothetical protein